MGLASAPEEAHRCKETSPLNFTINFPNVYLVSRRYIYTMLDSTVSSVIIQLEPHQLVSDWKWQDTRMAKKQEEELSESS